MAMASEQNNVRTKAEFDNEKLRTLCSEFEFKVSYDFKRLVFLAPLYGDVSFDEKMHEIYSTEGYQAHKIAYHGKMMSHIHIRYENEAKATEAINYFNRPSNVEGGRVSATKVSDLLMTIYATENMESRFPAWTLTVVDVEGTVEHTDPLSKDVVNRLLLKFGEPRIFTYPTQQNKLNHVQALFSSMAEALGASIAHGNWLKMDEHETPRFRYRVRLIGSDKEKNVMRLFSGDNSDGVFEMDYFVGNDLPNFRAPAPVPYLIPSQQFNLSVGPPNVHIGPPNVPLGPPNVHIGPPNVHLGPSNLSVGPPNVHLGPSNLSVGLPQNRQRRTFSKSREVAYASRYPNNYKQHRPYPRGGNKVPQIQIPMVPEQNQDTQTENLPN